MSPTPITVTLALCVVTVIADSFLKRAGQEPHFLNLWFAAGTFLYAASTFGWVYILRHLSFAEVGVIYSVSVVLLLVVAGVVFFKETLRASEYVGIALAIASILLLRRFS